MVIAYVEQIQSLPPNFDDFTAEISSELTKLYGPEAGAEYAANASQRFSETMRHPQVRTLGLWVDGVLAGMGVAVIRDDVGQIIFLHVLERYTGLGIEDNLFTALVEVLRPTGVAGIVCEFLPMSAIEIAEAETRLGFTRVPRLLMRRPLHNHVTAMEASSRPLQPDDWAEAAEVLMSAYADHPGFAYHAEVQNFERATSFVAAAQQGGFGANVHDGSRIYEDAGEVAGMLLACRAAPSTGFILHVAVRPRQQGKGIGQRMIEDAFAAFLAAGMTHASLGVTETNPARRLYERMSFEVIRSFHTSVWWADTTRTPEN